MTKDAALNLVTITSNSLAHSSFFFSLFLTLSITIHVPTPSHKKAWTHLHGKKKTKQGSFTRPSLFTSLFLSTFPVRNVHHSPPRSKKEKYYHQRTSQNGSSEDIPHHPTGPFHTHTTYHIQQSFQDSKAKKTRFSTTKKHMHKSVTVPFFRLPQKPAHLLLLHVSLTHPLNCRRHAPQRQKRRQGKATRSPGLSTAPGSALFYPSVLVGPSQKKHCPAKHS